MSYLNDAINEPWTLKKKGQKSHLKLQREVIRTNFSEERHDVDTW